MFCQAVVELVSPSQSMLQLLPALKTVFGPGSVGVTSADTKKAWRTATIAVRMIFGSIENLRLSMCK